MSEFLGVASLSISEGFVCLQKWRLYMINVKSKQIRSSHVEGKKAKYFYCDEA